MNTPLSTHPNIRRHYRWDEIPVPRTVAEAEAAIALVNSCIDSCTWEIEGVPTDQARRIERIASARAAWNRVLLMLKFSRETLLSDDAPDSARMALLQRDLDSEKEARANITRELWRQLLMFEVFVLHGGDTEAFLRKTNEEVPHEYRDRVVAERKALGLRCPRHSSELPPRGNAKGKT